MPEENDVAEEVDINAPKIEGGTEEEDIEIPGEDISQAEASGGKEWVEPAKDVVFEITKASINTYTPKDRADWKSRSLKLYLKVDSAGVDKKGKYAGKVFFPNSAGNVFGFLITVNREAYDFTQNAQGKPTTWYTPKTGGAFAGYKELLTALGLPTNPTPTVNKAFLDSLIGKKVMGNIDKKHRQVLDGGKYVDVPDEFENEISKLRPVKAAAVSNTEAAVA
jgi:hypothetical protein